MGKLQEYIKLIPAGIKNIDKIVDGLANQVKMELGTLPKEDEEVIVGRRLICSQCPFNSINAKQAGWYTTDRTDYHCSHCGCPINTKTASLDEDCGLKTFNLNNPQNQIPLKWVAVKK